MSNTEPRIAGCVHIRPLPYVISTCHGDRTVLLNAHTGRYYTLNAAGGDVWAGLCAEQSRNMIVSQLADRYGVSTDTVLTDVDKLLSRLLAAALIECQ
jgi:hypothetical protein